MTRLLRTMRPHRLLTSWPGWRPLDLALAALAAACLVAIAMASGDRVAWPGLGGGTLVVADLRGRALTLIELQSGASRSIALEGGPHELLRLPDGRMAVSLEQAGRVALVELASGHVDYLETGGLPHGLALEGDTLLMTDRAAEAIRRFDVRSRTELAPLASGALPHQIGRARGALLVADASAGRLALGDQRFVGQPAVTESIAVSPDEDRVAVAGAGDGRVVVYGVADGVVRLDVALGGRPVRLLYDPAGVILAVALSAAGDVALIDQQGVVRRVEVGGVPDGLAFTPDGRLLFASDMAGGAVTVIETASGHPIGSLDGGATAGALAFLHVPE